METNKYYIEIVRDIGEIEDLFRYITQAQGELDELKDEKEQVFPEDYPKRELKILLEAMDNRIWEQDRVIDRYYDNIEKYIDIIESIIEDNNLSVVDLAEYLNTEVSDISVDHDPKDDLDYFSIYLPGVDEQIYIGIKNVKQKQKENN